MNVKIYKRYDLNGAWTHDIKIENESHVEPQNTMYKLWLEVDVIGLLDKISELESSIKELKSIAITLGEDNESLEAELEDLTEQNRLLILRIQNK